MFYCKHKKYKLFGYCTYQKRDCVPQGCSYLRDVIKRKARDKRKRDKSTIINQLGNKQ